MGLSKYTPDTFKPFSIGHSTTMKKYQWIICVNLKMMWFIKHFVKALDHSVCLRKFPEISTKKLKAGILDGREIR